MTDHDAEADAIVAVLEAAGLIAVEVRADGEESYVLTPDGERVARQLAMSRVASRICWKSTDDSGSSALIG